MRFGCLSVVRQQASAHDLFGFTSGACRCVGVFFGKILRRPHGATATSTGAAAADVQVVPRTCICDFHGASSSAGIAVALKRAFWDLEDVLAYVGTAKSSGGFVCTDLPCCPEFKRNENNYLAFFFTIAHVAVLGINSLSQRPHLRKLLWWTKRQRLHEHMFCELCCLVTSLVQDAPGGAENTRCNTDT